MHLYIEKEKKWDNVKKTSDFARKFHQNFHVVVALHHFSPTKFYTFMERSWPEERLSDCNLFFLALPLKKKADEWKMFQSNEMLANQYFVNILGNWSAARVKIIQKEPISTSFDEIYRNLEYHDYCVVLPCILFSALHWCISKAWDW